MEFGHWSLPQGIKSIPADAIGFVYIITNKISGKKYIGKKLLVNKKKKKPLKGRKRARRYLAESDWKSYTGSSPSLQEDIEKLGNDQFLFEILSFHPSKLLLGYWETKTIVDANALFQNDYYNEVLNVRIRARKLI